MIIKCKQIPTNHNNYYKYQQIRTNINKYRSMKINNYEKQQISTNIAKEQQIPTKNNK